MNFPAPFGTFTCDLTKADYAQALGQLVACWPHLEDALIRVMASLLGDLQAPARQVFRALNAERARIMVMTSLLEEAQINRHKDRWYDDVIAEFNRLNSIRNNFVHGLWHTHDNGTVYLASPSVAELGLFDPEREVELTEITDAVAQAHTLIKKIILELFDAHKRGSLQKKRPRPSDVKTS